MVLLVVVKLNHVKARLEKNNKKKLVPNRVPSTAQTLNTHDLTLFFTLENYDSLGDQRN